jgi:hypothetical protein
MSSPEIYSSNPFSPTLHNQKLFNLPEESKEELPLVAAYHPFELSIGTTPG